MKSLFLLVAAIFCCQLTAQTPCGDSSKNWNFEIGNTYYECIFIDTMLKDSAAGILALKSMIQPFASQINVSGYSVSAIATNYSIYDKSCGFNWANTGGFMRDPISFNILISFKPGKYKVKCTNFTTDITISGNRSVFNWNTELYNRSGCLKGLVSMPQFEYADCKFQKMFKPENKSKSDW